MRKQVLLVANVELVAHALGVVFDFGEQLAAGVGIAEQSGVDLALEVVPGLPLLAALLVDLQVDLDVQVHVHLQVLLLRHHLAELLGLELFGRRHGLQVGVRLLLGEGVVVGLLVVGEGEAIAFIE